MKRLKRPTKGLMLAVLLIGVSSIEVQGEEKAMKPPTHSLEEVYDSLMGEDKKEEMYLEEVVPEEVKIPDPNLRKALLEAVGKKETESLYNVDLLKIEKLVLANKGIKSIEGLGECKNLKQLSLLGNELEDISELKKLKGLTLLNADSNNIKDISPLSELTNLTQLSLHKNKIENIEALSGLSKLEILVLNENKIKDITELRGLKNLKGLYVAYNELKSIESVESLEKLEAVQLNYNSITDLRPLKELKNLKQCSVDNQTVKLEAKYVKGDKVELELPKVYDREGNELEGYLETEGVKVREEEGLVILDFEGEEVEKDISTVKKSYTGEVDVIYGKVKYSVKVEQPYIRLIEGIDYKGGTGEKGNPVEIEVKSLQGLRKMLEVMPQCKLTKEEGVKIEGKNRVYELVRGVGIESTYINVKIEESNEEFKYLFESEYKDEKVVGEEVVGSLTDIEGHWGEENIKEFVSKGYIKGYVDGTFKPEGEMTRAEFVKVLNRVYKFNEEGAEEVKSFKDVKEKAWYAKDVAIALKEGYIGGYEDGTFRPNAPITRQEVANIIGNIEGVESKVEGVVETYKDSGEIGLWAKASVGVVLEKGYMGGYEDGTFKPNKEITRAEAVTILNNVEKGLKK